MGRQVTITIRGAYTDCDDLVESRWGKPLGVGCYLMTGDRDYVFSVEDEGVLADMKEVAGRCPDIMEVSEREVMQ